MRPRKPPAFRSFLRRDPQPGHRLRSTILKLLVFAHKPPPHHGQSYMVQLLLDALGGDARSRPAGEGAPGGIACYHVDARYSRDAADVGRARWGKVFLAVKFALQAIACRLRHGADNLYYVPAFPARTPVVRDWLVLTLCRPFFRRIIFHWHTADLGEWLAKEAPAWMRSLSRWLYPKPDLSIVLRPFNRTDALALRSKRIEVVPNGIPDPCPGFEREVLPRRLARAAARKKLVAGEQWPNPELAAAGTDARLFRVLFVSLCFSGKGLFDAVEGVALAHQRLKNSPMRVRLTVAGTFWLEAEKAQFEARVRQPDLQDEGQPLVDYRGFVSGEDKRRLFIESDCLCFPTRMAESFGLVLVEGMAFGLPLITTNWRDIPELLPPDPPGIVAPNSPEQIAAVMVSYLGRDHDPKLREHFLAHYTEQRFAENMKRVLSSL